MLHYPEHLHFIASVTNLQITYCSEVYHKLEFLIADLLPFLFFCWSRYKSSYDTSHLSFTRAEIVLFGYYWNTLLLSIKYRTLTSLYCKIG